MIAMIPSNFLKICGEYSFTGTDSMLERLTAGSTNSILAKIYLGFSCYLIAWKSSRHKGIVNFRNPGIVPPVWKRDLPEQTCCLSNGESA